MFVKLFEHPTFIDDENQLREFFGTNLVSLDKFSSVVFYGEITLGSEILFSGACSFSNGTSIENGCILTNVQLMNENRVRPYSILSNLKAGSRNIFGPFCFIRDECFVADDCILGAHVETTRSVFSNGVKVSHHAFIGDATIGERTVIGAGVIFCNHDGLVRQITCVGSDVIMGSGTLIVAPLSVGNSSLIAAGSTITKDVPLGMKIIQKRY